jgi:hypothetical protein
MIGIISFGDVVILADLPQCPDVPITLATVATDEWNSMLTLVTRLFLSHNAPLSGKPIHQRLSRQALQTSGWPGQRYSDKNNSKKLRKNNKVGPYARQDLLQERLNLE